MGGKSNIDWTDKTWNPTLGCSIVSDECRSCYAMIWSNRFRNATKKDGSPHALSGLTKVTSAGPVWNNKIKLMHDRVDQPLRWRKGAMIFVDSMSDLFHPDVPESFIFEVFTTMSKASQHIFQVLTKRPERMRDIMLKLQDINSATKNPIPWPIPNVWLGTSVGRQKFADERIPFLSQTPATVRFLSMEPLLEAINFNDLMIDHPVDWIIVGGESGRGSDIRPMHPDWIRDIRETCKVWNIAFFFKQWGQFVPDDHMMEGMPRRRYAGYSAIDREGHAQSYDETRWGTIQVWEVGKKHSGYILDGTTHREYPATLK